MANYHVTKKQDIGKWAAKREKAERVAGYFETQAKAEKAAKELAANSGEAKLEFIAPKGLLEIVIQCPRQKDPLSA